MKLAILGATGRTGMHLVELAVAKGHRVTCLSRSRVCSDLRCSDIVVGDAGDANALAELAEGADAIVSCLGQRSNTDQGVLTRSAIAALVALRGRETGYLVLSQGLLWQTRSPLVAGLRLLLKRHVEDSRSMEAGILASDANWTIVRAPRLTSGPARGYRVTVDCRPNGLSLSRRDLAACLLDSVETGLHVRRVIGVGPMPAARFDDQIQPAATGSSSSSHAAS